MLRWPRTARHVDPHAPADLVLREGAVLVGRQGDGPRYAPALAIASGTIQAVGAVDDVMRLASDTTTVVDLGGRTVIPGLHDSHLHVLRGGATWSDEVVWFEVPSLEEALGRLRDEVARRPPGSWIRVVGGWHHGQFREGRGPTREELTALAPEHPVYVQLLYEQAMLNDAGLRAAGIGNGSDDLPDGAVERNPDTGEPTGVVRGIPAFNHCLGRIPAMSSSEQVDSTRHLLAHLNAYGLTGAIDPGGFGMGAEAYAPVMQLWRDGGMTLKVRTYVCPLTRGHEHEELEAWMRHTHPGFGDPWLRHVGIGEIVHFGCHDLEGLHPFTIDEGAATELEQTLVSAARRGWPVHLHAILPDTASTILDVWERVHAQVPIGDLRWSLAHTDAIRERDLDRVAALGAGIAVQDRLVYRAADSARAWGEEAMGGAPPLRSIVERSIPLGAGTDATRVTSPNPWVSLWWLVTGGNLDGGPRRDPGQRLGRLEALEAYTRGSAWFCFEEHDRGAIDVGMAADLAVLSDDFFSVPDDDIRGLRAELTVVEGRPVHASGDLAGLA